ncbi:MAG: DUF2062 domain-containing protein [Candidatus Omnitrophota bacterium]|jgi:hypothetical protein
MPKRSFKEIIAILVRAFKAHNKPHEIALGVAIGAFIGILPVYGFHTILCVIAFFLIPKANKLAVLLGTNVSLPPTVATITWTAYDIGRMILINKHYPPISWEYLRDLRFSKISAFYYPLLIGSVVLGLLVALILYLITWVIVNQIRKKHALKK